MSDKERRKLISNNTMLNSIYQKLNAAVFHLKLKSLSLSPDNVKTEFAKDQLPDTVIADKSIAAWYEAFIVKKEKEIGAGINSYRSTFEHYKTFTAGTGVLHLSDLTKEFLEKFRDYLEGLKLSGPTIHKQFKNLRIFLRWVAGENEGIQIPTVCMKFKVKARYGDPIGLTVDQFFQLYQKDLSKRKCLEQTRDVFVFAVSIGGPRHGDLKRMAETLKKNGFKVNQNTITYFEGKTGNAHQEIVLNKIGLEILAKYNNVLPRVPTNQRMNTNLRAIARLLDWNQIKYVPQYDSYGRLTSVDELPLKEVFSTKFMRKTAATIDNMLGIPTKTSMKRTGHKTFAAYSRYVDVNKDSLEQANQQWDDLVTKVVEEPRSEYRIAS
ncbi:MAG: site-specific integrase [Cytophagales bacterium]|nr:site-specific integrase [Cytophagales bacterium]